MLQVLVPSVGDPCHVKGGNDGTDAPDTGPNEL